jgi:hypothetical protein
MSALECSNVFQPPSKPKDLQDLLLGELARAVSNHDTSVFQQDDPQQLSRGMMDVAPYSRDFATQQDFDRATALWEVFSFFNQTTDPSEGDAFLVPFPKDYSGLLPQIVDLMPYFFDTIDGSFVTGTSIQAWYPGPDWFAPGFGGGDDEGDD